ncbi:MAG: stage III sporulation protein AB [Oscillospiraceae bacterium]
MNILPAAALFAACTIIGLCQSRMLKLRAENLGELEQLCAEISLEMRCTAPPLERLAGSLHGEFAGLLNSELSVGSDIRRAWEDSCEKLGRRGYCRLDEQQLLRELGAALGTTSAEGQLKLLELYRGRFAELRAAALEEYSKKGRLFRSVGALAGAGAAVLVL